MAIKTVLITMLASAICGCGFAQTSDSDANIVYGIAAKYPGDKGIEQDKAVLFHDDFESGKPGSRWDHIRGIRHIETETDPNIARGELSAKFVVKKFRNTDTTIWKWIPPQDELYMRHYARYGEDFGYQRHGGSGFYAWSDYRFGAGGHAGRAPAGDEGFWGHLEAEWMRSKYAPPGALNFYVYWWKMKPYPSGKHYGNSFMTEPVQIPKRGEWICFEWRVKVNTPAEDDGELDCWVNGVKCGEFRGINWRSVESLKLNQVDLALYLPTADFDTRGGGESRTIWYDDVVVATEYIGPKTDEKIISK